ncbi:hypothetical protein [Nonomuraea jabiensis]|uniref:hypothetical protein n=1 Tax=Nonomuraea jabiensis TaxID=882448 RepID=UPI003D757938
MEVVSAVEGRPDPIGVGGVGDRALEVDDRVEFAAGPDPRVDRIADGLGLVGETGRQEGAADDPDSSRVGGADEPPVAVDQVVGADLDRRCGAGRAR